MKQLTSNRGLFLAMEVLLVMGALLRSAIATRLDGFTVTRPITLPRGSLTGGMPMGTLLFLAIDPTVAAHLPVVMTGLPAALLSAAAVVLATLAFRTWLRTDLVTCSAMLGLDLATKHFAPVFVVSITLVGIAMALAAPSSRQPQSRALRLAKLVCRGSWRSACLMGCLLLLEI